MAAHVRDQEYRFETDKWFLDPSEVEYRTNNRVSGEGVSFNPFTRVFEIFGFIFFFFFYTVLKFVYVRYSKDLKDFFFYHYILISRFK